MALESDNKINRILNIWIVSTRGFNLNNKQLDELVLTM